MASFSAIQSTSHCLMALIISTFSNLVIWVKTYNWLPNVDKIRSELLNLAFPVSSLLGLCAYTTLPPGVMVCNNWNGSCTSQSEGASLWTAYQAPLGTLAECHFASQPTYHPTLTPTKCVCNPLTQQNKTKKSLALGGFCF